MAALPRSVDAAVIGGGPNGLVAAALLADAGWSVLLLEAGEELGGAVKSRGVDGWTMDRFSSCYPLAAASPVFRALELESHGLRWARAETVLAHPLGPDDPQGAFVHQNRELTAAHLAEESPADGDTWLELCSGWDELRESFLQALLTAWPPIRATRRLLRDVGGMSSALRLARFLALPAVRMGEELFTGQRGRALLAGNAMHADAPLEAPVSGMMGWLMLMLAQDVGFPSPVGGAAQLTAALAARAGSAGAQLVTGEPVVGIDVGAGTARRVRTASGQTVICTKAIVADTSALALYRDLLPAGDVPKVLVEDLDRLQWDLPTVKVNYRLRATPRWTAVHARSAGVVHAGADAVGLQRWATDLSTRTVPQTPFALVGQMSTIDPGRSPAGTEALWAYTHLPRGVDSDDEANRLADRLEEMLESHAPGFAGLVIDRDVQTPHSLTAEDANLLHGAVGGGTSQLHQQLVFRPVPGPGGARTPISRLYLGSAAIHPGGGVHGGCGALAARAALADSGFFGPVRRRVAGGIIERLYRDRPSAM